MDIENFKLPTPDQFDRTLKIVNYIHVILAVLSLLLFIWTVMTMATTEAKVWSIFAFVLFVGMVFYTNSVRKTILKRDDRD